MDYQIDRFSSTYLAAVGTVLNVLCSRHLLFAPSAINHYAGSVFPSVVDAMFNATTFADWQEVDRQLSLVAVHLRYAAQILNQYTNPII